jgi:hypothetical protein
MRSFIPIFLLISALLSLSGPAQANEPEAFATFFIDANPDRPAWIKITDLDGDGQPELVVSVFAKSSPAGAGYVAIYKRQGGLGVWRKTVLPGSQGTKFANDVTISDVDEDGDLDIIVPAGFLATTPFSSGAIAWYENLGGNTWKKHTLFEKQKLFYHYVEHVDIDGDGIRDFVTVAERVGATEVQYFKGKGKGVFSTTACVLYRNVLGSIPTVVDLDGDGDPDIVSAQFFVPGASAAWLENIGGGTWRHHVITDQVGPSIQFALIPNLCGDGRTMGVLANHVNSADTPEGPKEGVFLLPVPETKDDLIAPWPFKLIAAGIKSRPSPMMMPQGAPGVFHWGDIDGDGDIDLVVHGDGDPRVFWLEQVAPGQFETRVIMNDMPQGGVAVGDLDGDGVSEIIVSSYEKNRLAILKKKMGTP